MSQPRQVVEKATYFVSRRCAERRGFLRPDPIVSATYLFLLAVAAPAFGIVIHCFALMPNHHHIVLTDLQGNLPRFLELFHGLLARVMNRHLNRRESFFAPGSYSAVRLRNPQDILDKMVYALTNPVTAGLVARGDEWTGATSLRWGFREVHTFQRPDLAFFAGDTSYPLEASLSVAVPPGFEDLSPQEFARLLTERVQAREAEIRAAFAAQGRGFLGMRRVLQMDRNSIPRTEEPFRKLNPRLAAKDREERIEAIEELQAFRRAYREAWLAWKRGDTGVLFPPGTWLMRVRYHAACEPSPE